MLHLAGSTGLFLIDRGALMGKPDERSYLVNLRNAIHYGVGLLR